MCAGEAVVTRDLVVRYDDFVALDRRHRHRAFRRSARHRRPQRLGKIHAAENARRAPDANRRRAVRARHAAAEAAAGLDCLRAANRSRRLVVSGNRVGRRRDGALSAPAVLAAFRGARSRRRRSHALEAVNMESLADGTSRSSPADSSSASSSRARSRRSRGCCCSTNRPPASTRQPKKRCANSCASWSPAACRCVMTTHDLDRVDEWFDRLLVLDRRVLAHRRSARSRRIGRVRRPSASTRTRTATCAPTTKPTRRTPPIRKSAGEFRRLDRAVPLRVHAARLRRGARRRAAVFDDGHVRRAAQTLVHRRRHRARVVRRHRHRVSARRELLHRRGDRRRRDGGRHRLRHRGADAFRSTRRSACSSPACSRSASF